MPYPRYGGGNYQNPNPQSSNVSPWQNSQPFNQNNLAMASNFLGANVANLATSLVAQALQGGGINPTPFNAGGGPSSYNDDRRGRDFPQRRPYRRSRSRSPIRDDSRGRNRRDFGDRNRAPIKRRERTPPFRPEHEIYIGNYPQAFREADVRQLFENANIEVKTIRLKFDGHKVFAFAETISEAEIRKAIAKMDSKEIQGRRLRVRSTKDKDRVTPGSKQPRKDDKAAAKKEIVPPPKPEVTEDEKTRYLVFAFMAFLQRQKALDVFDDDAKAKIDKVHDDLVDIFEISDDESLTVNRKLETIFHQNTRHIIKSVEKANKTKEEEEKAKESEEKAEEVVEPEEHEVVGEAIVVKDPDPEEVDDDGNWKRRQVSKKDEDDENDAEDDEEEEDVEDNKDAEMENILNDVDEVIVNAEEDILDGVADDETSVADQEKEKPAENEEEKVDSEELPQPVPATPRGRGRGRGAQRARRSRGRRGA